jgi:hypothetical protein
MLDADASTAELAALHFFLVRGLRALCGIGCLAQRPDSVAEERSLNEARNARLCVGVPSRARSEILGAARGAKGDGYKKKGRA